MIRHFGGLRERPDRYPKIDSFEWQPGCHTRPWSADQMVKDLVEMGGFLILGGTCHRGIDDVYEVVTSPNRRAQASCDVR